MYMQRRLGFEATLGPGAETRTGTHTAPDVSMTAHIETLPVEEVRQVECFLFPVSIRSASFHILLLYASMVTPLPPFLPSNVHHAIIFIRLELLTRL